MKVMNVLRDPQVRVRLRFTGDMRSARMVLRYKRWRECLTALVWHP